MIYAMEVCMHKINEVFEALQNHAVQKNDEEALVLTGEAIEATFMALQVLNDEYISRLALKGNKV